MSRTPKMLSEFVSVQARFARSTNLERDLAASSDNTKTASPLDGYVLTARATDMVERVINTAIHSSAGGAWSLTGPYGSGKSTLALFLAALFGRSGPQRNQALKLLSANQLSGQLDHIHQQHQTKRTGFFTGLVTASTEPLTHTIIRGLGNAVHARWGKVPSKKVLPTGQILKLWAKRSQTERSLVATNKLNPLQLVELARDLATQAPLLLIVDEFGKNLEVNRGDPSTDPYLLQQLAELGQGSGLPLFLLTLQHLSFEDYMDGAEKAVRQEWAKVQGRFEDIVYIDSPSQTRVLIGSAINHRSTFSARIKTWAQQCSTQMKELGLFEVSDPDRIGEWYPLHPLTAAVLPELCIRFGQHERTLFSFLCGTETAGLRDFLRNTEVPSAKPGRRASSFREMLPTVGLDRVYDYFVGNGSVQPIGATSRWTEIVTRLRDLHGIDPEELALLKTIAVLNLVASQGMLRASHSVLSTLFPQAPKLLENLEQSSLITHRSFSDEYRIWEGSDLDLSTMITRASSEVSGLSLLEVLQQLRSPEPMVAARHSTDHNLLRVFSRQYLSGLEPIDPPILENGFDGHLFLQVDNLGQSPRLAGGEKVWNQPVLIAQPQTTTELDQAARRLLALQQVIDSEQLEGDWVSRREIGERLVQASTNFEQILDTTFKPDNCRWWLLDRDGELVSPPSIGRGSSVLSWAADRFYRHTPMIANEVINRDDLSSQGSQALKLLLAAMIEHPNKPGLGLEGYGPEVAIYKAVLQNSLHREQRDGTFRFVKIDNRSKVDQKLISVWTAMAELVTESQKSRVNLASFISTLRHPPFGLKAGVIPVLLTALLLERQDSVALYEHGTFRPIFSTQISERMVKNPHHFEIKNFANTTGARRQVIQTLAKELGIGPAYRKQRVSEVLAVVGSLITETQMVPIFTRNTKSYLKPVTRQVLDQLLAATEPDQLIFADLPRIFGFDPIETSAKTYTHTEEYANQMRHCVQEIRECYPDLMKELFDELLAELGAIDRQEVTEMNTRFETDRLAADIRAFVLALRNTVHENDEDWIGAIATVVSGKSPTVWTDLDRAQYTLQLQALVTPLRRLSTLYNKTSQQKDQDVIYVEFTHSDGRSYEGMVRSHSQTPNLWEEQIDEMFSQLEEKIGNERETLDILTDWLSRQEFERAENVVTIQNNLVDVTSIVPEYASA